MDRFVIRGGSRLCGRIRVHGSKNAALPLLAAVLLTDEPVVLRDVPDLADIQNMRRLLGELGVEITEAARSTPAQPAGIQLRVVDRAATHARYEIVRTMRASICALGPMLARRGYARVSMPGGCAIGDRPVDLHLRGLEALGAEITLESGDIVARTPGGPGGRLRGATVFLGGPFGSTVLGTANVMSAATLADGVTVIESAACEPEIVDLARLLNRMGARIRGAGSPRIIIHGVESLGGADHRVIPDRIEAGTFMVAAAITNGDITLENCPVDALLAATHLLDRIGVIITREPALPTDEDTSDSYNNDADSNHGHAAAAGYSTDADGFDQRLSDPMRSTVRITCSRVIRPVELATQPHPGFPTDLQAQFMALLCLADGNSVITERIYPERFLHVAELARMGARIHRQGPTAVVSGVRRLVGAPVMASDLRASASLVLAGLAAEGVTTVNRVYHLDRGYERMEERLADLGADIRREVEPMEESAPSVVVIPAASAAATKAR